MPILAGASYAAVVGLRCPKCGERQLRAREKVDHVYTCVRCHQTFTRELTSPAKARGKARR